MEKQCCSREAHFLGGKLCDDCEKSCVKSRCVDCKIIFKQTFGLWAEIDFRCKECEKKWAATFKLCCSHCGESLAFQCYTECNKCHDDYSLCGDCCRSGEIFHQHDSFTGELYMGDGPLTMMMSSLSGRRVVENRKDAYPEKGSCRFCQTDTKRKCSRCKVFYCSTDCQKSDWERHRNFCRPITKKEEEEREQEIKQPSSS